ncbi:hypothetical protein [Arcanobacterium ihumii]|uniref:hypothetical protein n=1 Tax=Arcanobacterium ihumii TaxID=2138162 RepID=UPI000F5282BF|nr:hypothetical protein [Arcanobacterium ihumii]
MQMFGLVDTSTLVASILLFLVALGWTSFRLPYLWKRRIHDYYTTLPSGSEIRNESAVAEDDVANRSTGESPLADRSVADSVAGGNDTKSDSLDAVKPSTIEKSIVKLPRRFVVKRYISQACGAALCCGLAIWIAILVANHNTLWFRDWNDLFHRLINL